MGHKIRLFCDEISIETLKETDLEIVQALFDSQSRLYTVQRHLLLTADDQRCP